MASGLIADQIGRRMLLLISAGLIAVFAICSTIAPLIVEENAIGQTIYVNAGFALLGLSYGQSSGAVTSRSSNAIATPARRLTNDLAWLLGAGFAPLIVLFLSARYGLACVGLYLLSGAVTTLLALSHVPLGNPAGLSRADAECPPPIGTLSLLHGKHEVTALAIRPEPRAACPRAGPRAKCLRVAGVARRLGAAHRLQAWSSWTPPATSRSSSATSSSRPPR